MQGKAQVVFGVDEEKEDHAENYVDFPGDYDQK